jgi:hypothetical protein
MNRHAFQYSIKVWLTTSIIAVLLITLFRYILLRVLLSATNCDNKCAAIQYHKFVIKQSGMVAVSLIGLIPLAIAIYYGVITLLSTKKSINSRRLYLTFIGVVFVLLPHLILLVYAIVSNVDYLYNRAFFVNGPFYVVTVIASIWCYPLRD